MKVEGRGESGWCGRCRCADVVLGMQDKISVLLLMLEQIVFPRKGFGAARRRARIVLTGSRSLMGRNVTVQVCVKVEGFQAAWSCTQISPLVSAVDVGAVLNVRSCLVDIWLENAYFRSHFLL